MDTETISGAASTIASLLILLGLLAALAFLARRFKGRFPGSKAGGNMPVSILSSRPLGGQHSLVIAEADGQRFLLGVSRGGIALITRLETHEPNSHE
ncbi:MAG: flagellar biosynthetic protein FliO [Rhodospirillales bacterium]|nr:flagellar biosynthetic protein FliO [Rhodospirillales bacterium]MDE1883137.1 flagellar biosynthetic protein FliO [Rhodospirillales bacterium]MDE2390103.1 flagellar biosynthetic protein FliO [Rhodospirillales bacterium]